MAIYNREAGLGFERAMQEYIMGDKAYGLGSLRERVKRSKNDILSIAEGKIRKDARRNAVGMVCKIAIQVGKKLKEVLGNGYGFDVRIKGNDTNYIIYFIAYVDKNPLTYEVLGKVKIDKEEESIIHYVWCGEKPNEISFSDGGIRMICNYLPYSEGNFRVCIRERINNVEAGKADMSKEVVEAYLRSQDLNYYIKHCNVMGIKI